MSLYYLSGEKFNHVGRGPNAITSVGTVNSLFPLTNLGAFRPRKPFSFSQSIADMRVIVDTDLVTDGGFEGTLSDGWTDADTGDGVSDQHATPKFGTFSLRLVANTGTAGRYQDITMRTGERAEVRGGWVRLDGTGTVTLQVTNRRTGNYLTSAGAWQASAASIWSVTADTSSVFVEQTDVQFQMETRAVHGGLDTADLRATLTATGASITAAYVDDLELIPAINFLGMFSHNFDPILTPTWRADDDSAFGSATTLSTPTIAQPNFYSYLSSPNYERYKDLLLSGGPQLANPRGGDLVMGYAETAARQQQMGWGNAYAQRQARMETPEGDQYVTSKGPHAIRTLRLPLKHQSLSDHNEVRGEIFERSGYGRRPGVIVPASTEPDVIFGRCQDKWGVSRAINESVILSNVGFREEPHMDWIDG